MSTRSVPRATTRPSGRDEVLPSSSVIALACEILGMRRGGEMTSENFLYVVQNQVHQRIVTLECAVDCQKIILALNPGK
jgi:hypothetical protein